jgi:glycosyltransferase involved in cell wall biosynthesis
MLSIWNVFFNCEQRKAFEAAGLPVHWVGNHYPPKKCEVAQRSFDWVSFSILMLYFRKLGGEWMRHLSMTLFDWFSGTRRLNADLVWAYVEMNTRLLAKARRKGIPTVLDVPIAHMRDYYNCLKPEYDQLGLKFHDRLVRKWMERAEIEYEAADWIVAGSNFVKESLVKHGVDSSKIIINHYGVDTSLWATTHKRCNAKRTKMTFVYTALIGPRKGIQYLIKAWTLAEISDAELVICGSGDMPWEKIQNPMPTNVLFLGRLKHEKLAEIYSEADVYVLPSLLEGFARSGVEAMAAGLPLIITEETGLTDFCDDGVEGWVVPSRNVESLADRLRWCRAHPEEVRVAGDRAYSRMRDQSFDGYGAKCVAIANAIIGGAKTLAEIEAAMGNANK